MDLEASFREGDIEDMKLQSFDEYLSCRMQQHQRGSADGRGLSSNGRDGLLPLSPTLTRVSSAEDAK